MIKIVYIPSVIEIAYLLKHSYKFVDHFRCIFNSPDLPYNYRDAERIPDVDRYSEYVKDINHLELERGCFHYDPTENNDWWL